MRKNSPDDPANKVGSRFVTTQWTAVLDALSSPDDDGDKVAATRALDSLCRDYWMPVYAYIRRYGRSPEDAEDLTQGFFEYVIARDPLKGVDPDKGRFRTYLLGAVNFFLKDQHRRSVAKKRGGGVVHQSFDAAGAEAALGTALQNEISPDKVFQQQWALVEMEGAVAQLRADYERRGKLDVFEALLPFLSESRPYGEYAKVAETLGISTNAVKMSAKRFRDRFTVHFRARIARTVRDEELIDEEVRELIRIFS